MKKFIYFFIILVFTILTRPYAQTDRNEKERTWIRTNQFKSKEQWDYRYTGDKPARKGFLSSKMVFDKDGRVTEITNFLNNGQVVNVSSYSFDPRGNQTEYIKYTGNKAKLSFRQTYTYDGKGNKTVETGFNGAEEYRNTYSYFSQGKLSEINYYLADKLDETRTFKYNGNEVEVTVTGADGSIKFKILSKLDDAGNTIEMVKAEKSGTPLEKTVYTYNGNSQLIKEESYLRGNFSERLSYVYDASGNLLEIWVEKAAGEKYMKNTNTYRPDGRILEEKWRSSPTADFSYKKYAYDSRGQLLATDSFFASYKYRVLNKYFYK